MIAILKEPAYSDSIWCKQLLQSFKDRLKQKRIPFHEVSDRVDETDDGVFILASDYHWIKATVTRLNAAGIKPILICNQAEPIHGCDYSCVCSDIGGSMKYLLGELKAAGRTRVALYGMNTSSISDIGRVDGLFAFKDDSFNEMRIFPNNGSLQNCFAEFSESIKALTPSFVQTILPPFRLCAICWKKHPLHSVISKFSAVRKRSFRHTTEIASPRSTCISSNTAKPPCSCMRR